MSASTKENKVVNHKADRQAAKRIARAGDRYARQRDQRRTGPNVRIREGNCDKGYTYTRLRDGKTV